MIIIANPSNPTGTCLSARDLMTLKNVCQQHGIYLVCDEVYEYYIFDGAFHSSTRLTLDSEFVIRVGSFSKNFAMSGWRVGFIVAPLSLVETMQAVQSGTLCCPNVIAQHAALCALDNELLMQEQIRKVKLGRDCAYEALAPLMEIGVLSRANARAGFYLFLKTPCVDMSPFIMDILKYAHVALAPGCDFGQSCAAYFRLCFAREHEVVQEGCTRLIQYFREHYESSLYAGQNRREEGTL
jgi:aspartate/methionine/tyrosine aminotransferase